MEKFEILKPAVRNTYVQNGSKMKANPYFGCEHKCLFCPANDGYLNKKVFDDYRNQEKISIVDNIIEHVSNYIDNAEGEVSVHLSPVADPFQPVEKKFGKSREIAEFCFKRNIPLAICTKALIPIDIIKELGKHKESFIQLSMLTINEKKRAYIVRGGGATVDEMFRQIEKLMSYGVNTLIRVDPIFPYITDDMVEFEKLIRTLADMGITTILSSCTDITNNALEGEKTYLDKYELGMYEKYKNLYTDIIQERRHAKLAYRKKLFSDMKEICMSVGVGFGITWEPDNEGKSLSPLYSFGAEEFALKLKKVVT